jgi:hypothetical protein
LLKDGWVELPEDDKEVYRMWTEWDKRRYARDLAIYDRRQVEKQKEDKPMDDDDLKAVHIPKKRKTESGNEISIPKKTKS